MTPRAFGEPQPLPLTIVLRQGATLARQGEPGDGLWLVEAGALRTSMVTNDGRELTLDVLGPGDAAGEPFGVVSGADVRTLRQTRLRPLDPRAAADLLAARAHRAAALAAELAWVGVQERVAWRLDDLAERFGRPVEGGTLLVLPLTQDELAALAGTSRESVSRALRALVSEGRIRVPAKGRYVVRSRLHAVEAAR